MRTIMSQGLLPAAIHLATFRRMAPEEAQKWVNKLSRVGQKARREKERAKAFLDRRLPRHVPGEPSQIPGVDASGLSELEKRIASTGSARSFPVTGPSSFEPIPLQAKKQCEFIKANVPADLDQIFAQLDRVFDEKNENYESDLKSTFGEKGLLRGLSAALKAGAKASHPEFRKAFRDRRLKKALADLEVFRRLHEDGFGRCGGLSAYQSDGREVFRFASAGELAEYKAYLQELVKKLRAVVDAYDESALSKETSKD